jgi:hypothetical protein
VTFTEICARFERVKLVGDGRATARCSAHEDRVASLSLSTGDGGKVLLHCHAGCETLDIIERAGLELGDLFNTVASAVPLTPVLTSRSASSQTIYRYADLAGATVGEVVRGPGKRFRQRRPDGDGGWEWKASQTPVVYRWPELSAQPDDPIWVVEGEKDAERLASVGLRATTNAGGAGKWRAAHTSALYDLSPPAVFVIPDNDVPGHRHALAVVEACTSAGLVASVVRLPDSPDHGDVSDWVSAGHTVEDLQALALAASAAPADVVVPTDFEDATQTLTRLSDGCYELQWPDLGVRFQADHVRRGRDGDLKGELTVTTDLAGARTVADGVLVWTSTNFSSQRVRASVAKACQERSGAKLDWVGALEEFSIQVARSEAAGTVAIQPLSNYDLPPTEDAQDWIVHGIPLSRDLPTIIYGPGGSGKSLVALSICQQLAERGIKCLYIDWEFSGAEHRKRLGQLAGDDIPTDMLHYVRCSSPLVVEVSRLAAYVTRHTVQFCVFDSVAYAAGGRPEEAEHATAYMRAVSQIGVGSLHLAHSVKSEEHQESAGPFGSVFWANSARSLWMIKRAPSEGGDDNVVEVAMTHKKSNTGRLMVPIGLRLTFDSARTTIQNMDLASSTLAHTTLPLWQRMRALVAARPMTVEDIAVELDAQPKSVARAVQRMTIFRRGGDGRIWLSSQLSSASAPAEDEDRF